MSRTRPRLSADRRRFAGGFLTLADIALVAYTRLAHEGGSDLGRRRHLADWIRRVEDALGLSGAGQGTPAPRA